MKQRIEDLKIYHTLCKVMSMTQAKCELMKVIEHDVVPYFDDNCHLFMCFSWMMSPQGVNFWGDIHDKLQQLED